MVSAVATGLKTTKKNLRSHTCNFTTLKLKLMPHVEGGATVCVVLTGWK